MNPEIAKYREALDEIDEQIISLLAEREKISKEIGKIKQEKNITIQDFEREKFIKNDRQEIAARYAMDTDFCIRVMDVILEHSRAQQTPAATAENGETQNE